MTREAKMLTAAETYVQDLLAGEASGHDWWHIVRVRNVARTLAQKEGADVFICELAALLHDIADEKIAGSEEAGLQQVRDWLGSTEATAEEVAHVLAIIQGISFQGGHNPHQLTTIEGKIVQDADRLDAIGAIGIARTMAYSGNKGRLIHDPAQTPREQLTKEDYRSDKGTAIMHFYEKLLLLKDKMNTPAAQAMAEGRHAFMEDYLTTFYAEWDGKQ